MSSTSKILNDWEKIFRSQKTLREKFHDFQQTLLSFTDYFRRWKKQFGFWRNQPKLVFLATFIVSLRTFMGSLTTFIGSLTTFMGSLTTFMVSPVTTFIGSLTTFMGSLTTFMVSPVTTFIGSLTTFIGFFRLSLISENVCSGDGYHSLKFHRFAKAFID